MKRIPILLLTFVFFRSNAQTVASTVSNATESIKTVKGWFTKKSKNSADNSTATSEAIPANSLIVAKTSSSTKYIDASRVNPFVNGAAIVMKGEAYGLIDTTGNFVIPYNKYKSIAYVGKHLLTAFDGKGEFLLNSKGAVLSDLGAFIHKGYSTMGVGDFMLIRQNGAKNFTLMDGSGKTYAITENKLPNGKYLEFSSISEQAVIVTANHAFGFKDLNNQLLAEPVFMTLQPFKNGFAVYSQVDSYGAPKYGVVDIHGKKTIAPIFSTMPTNLGGGYFRAEGAYDADFYYAILNSKGDIILKEMKSKPLAYGFNYYEDGYFFGNSHSVMDIAGHIMSDKELVTKAGFKQYDFLSFIPYSNADFLKVTNTDMSDHDGVLAFAYMQTNRIRKLGLLNIKTNQIILGPFSEASSLGYNYIFDPVAKMAMVSQDAGNNGSPAIIGYMSGDGQIKIVQAEKKSGW